MASQSIALYLFIPVVFFAFRWLFYSYQHARRAKAWSCKPPVHVADGLFGIRSFRAMAKAGKEKRFVYLLHDTHKQFGDTFSIDVLGSRAIHTDEPENIKALLATQFSDFSLGFRRSAFYPLLGDGIFTLDGAGWAHSRTILRPQFTRDQVSDLDQLDVHVRRLIDAFPKDKSAFDIQDLFFRLALDSATDFLFGESVESLVSSHNQTGISEKGTNGKLGFAEAFNLAQELVVQRARAGSFYWLIYPKELREATKIVHQFVDYYVDKALSSTSHFDGKLLDNRRYIFLEAIALQTRDRNVLRDQMLNILLAGRDTTSSLLSSVFYFLARHQRVWHTLRKEIVANFGDHRHSKTKITFSSLKEMQYLRFVLNETLRLLPPVPSNGRSVVKDTTLPVGGGPDRKSPVYVKKGQNVRYSVWCLHRRPDIWGTDSEEFRPERWAESPPRGWEYLPFNGGPRICLGQQYALTEAAYIIVKLLQRFDVLENADPDPDLGTRPVMALSLTMSHARGVRVRLYASTV